MSYHYPMNTNTNEFFDSTNYIPQMQMHHGYQDFYPSNATSQQPQSSNGAVMQDNQEMISDGGYGLWRQDWSSTSSQSQLWAVDPGLDHTGHLPMSHSHAPQMMTGSSGGGHVDHFRQNVCYMQEPLAPMPHKKEHPSPRLQSRSTPKPFRCHTCGKAFSQAANLTAHKRIHTGEKPFSCSVCLRPFSQSSSLVTHRRTHTGERPYPCGQCEKAFTDSSTLTKHLRTHTGNKPYACNICMMKFTQSGNLHRHMKTHK